MKSTLVLFVLGIAFALCSSCIDENGSPVDWWIILKAPYDSSTTDMNAKSGYGYAYADINNPNIQVIIIN
jgi:hypothetical protein